MKLHLFKTRINNILLSETIKYLFFGVLATIVYFITRTITYLIFDSAIFSSVIASIISILFAFFTNDIFVFNQSSQKRIKRLIKFFIARLFTLLLDMFFAWFLVDKYPNILGVLVKHNIQIVNILESFISQFFIIVLNYIISKFLIFK
ncbi:GtrA family protein [Streptococcus salivarius]|jgi:putative flippase GtrA|uniref:GtrA family protein n=1 Tax=Streptococcus salivarius TaxID=1304 RepID=UPI000A094571|nr:GtrA family protein [Streptococcus salivarius]ARI60664.1 sugar translocase [Streptococcus salivarius]